MSEVDLRRWLKLPDTTELPQDAILASTPNLPWESPPIPRIVPSVESWHRVMEVARDPETKRRAWVMMLEKAGFDRKRAMKLAKEFEP